MFQIGDIIFVSKFQFLNGKHGTNHMFIIVDIPNNVISNYQCFLISSKLQRLEFPYVKSLKRNNCNSLHKDSVVYCNGFINIRKENILFKVGKIDINELFKYYDCYEKYNASREILNKIAI